MSLLYYIFISFFISLLLVGWIHSRLVKIALMKNIVDNPNARKLQCTPVPVLGGVAVFFGSVVGLGCAGSLQDCTSLPIIITAMTIMLYLGTLDDILRLSPSLRFMIEILVVLLIVFISGYSINNFHGLWGVEQIPYWVAVPLTVFASVGIINALNLIDGVNGLSSGFGIMACTIFGILFYFVGNTTMSILAAALAGSLIPFFFHNVFGKTSKMFIGDGGALVLGLVMSIFVIAVLRENSICAAYVAPKFGLIPFALAVLCVPVFDTLRVMTMRILKGISPFNSDKTHLHHMFIELGGSHAGATVAILSLNMIVVLLWCVLVALGTSIEVQFYAVVGMSLMVTFGLYHFMQWHIRRNTKFLHVVRYFNSKANTLFRGFFLWMQKVVDKI